MDLKRLITEYLQEARLMQIATSHNNQPWVCSVYFAFDDALSLYWLSKPNTRHSKEIRENEKIAGAIVVPHSQGQDVRGLQFEGIAQELNNKNEVEQAARLYAKRFGVSEKRVEEIVNNTDGHLVYRIRPTAIVLYDEANFPDNPRQEYKT